MSDVGRGRDDEWERSCEKDMVAVGLALAAKVVPIHGQARQLESVQLMQGASCGSFCVVVREGANRRLCRLSSPRTFRPPPSECSASESFQSPRCTGGPIKLVQESFHLVAATRVVSCRAPWRQSARLLRPERSQCRLHPHSRLLFQARHSSSQHNLHQSAHCTP